MKYVCDVLLSKWMSDQNHPVDDPYSIEKTRGVGSNS